MQAFDFSFLPIGCERPRSAARFARALVAPVVVLALTLVVQPTSAKKPKGWEAVPAQAWQVTARPDSGGADAVVLFQRGEDWDRSGEFKHTMFRRIRVFTTKGREAGKVELPYEKHWGIENVRARSIRPDGSTTELSQDQIIHTNVIKRSGVEWNISSFIVPGMEPGCIVEYEYTIGGKYRGAWHGSSYFQSDWYTLEAVYRWHPSEWIVSRIRPAKWELYKILPFRVTVVSEPNEERPEVVTFQTRCVPGLEGEPFAPPAADAGAHVETYYGPGLNWSFASRAMEAVGGSYLEHLGPLERVVNDARARASDPFDALAIVHRWLQTHVRAIQELSWKERRDDRLRWRIEAIGVRVENPLFPAYPTDVYQWAVGPVAQNDPITSMVEHAWGTPYEINAAFVAAANRLGLHACVAFVGDRREAPFDGKPASQWPSEVITAVSVSSRRWRFYDPASAFAPIGSVPWYLRGGRCLLAGGDGAMFARITAEDGLPSRTRWDLDLALDGKGNLEGRVVATRAAEAARDMKAWLWEQDPDRWNDLLQDSFASGGTPKLHFDPPDIHADPESSFVLAGTADYEGFAPPAGGLMTVPVDRLLPWRFHAEFDRSERTQPLFFRHVIDQTIEASIHLPAGSAPMDLPAPRQFENGFGTFRTSWEQMTDGVRYRRTVQTRYAQLDRADYEVVTEFCNALEGADRDVLLVESP